VAAVVDLSPSSQPDVVSPELVLIDPRLAMGARALLSDSDETLARLGQRSPLNKPESLLPVWNVDPKSSADEDVSAALRRITELSEVEPMRPRRWLLSRVAVTVAWGAVVLFVADLQLGFYELPL
jgi:hypothetical protein